MLVYRMFIFKVLSPAFVFFFSSFFFFFFFGLLLFFSTAPVAYGGSQARGLIGATDAGLLQSHSNAGSKLRLWAMPDP